jgi:hypothetical protein
VELTCSTSDPCTDISSFVRTPMIQIDVWKRKADVSYNVQNFSIELIENMSSIYGTEGTEAKTYLDFYDRLFPHWSWKGRAAPGSLDITLQSLLYNFCFTQCAGSPSNITKSYMEMLLLPYLAQQEIEYELGTKSTASPPCIARNRININYQWRQARSTSPLCSALSTFYGA